ncbi:MAG: GNAT family N-acetyltransferase [Planctomycetes bacterium]|nr:GNAT family N-acetyltransferase [Planctomycetota bacterium]
MRRMTRASKSQFDVRQIPGGTQDQLRALHRVMDLNPPAGGTPAPPVQQMLATAQKGTNSLELLFGAYDEDRLVAAVLGMVCEGATALVLLSSELEHPEAYHGTLAALRRLVEASRLRSISLLEVLTAPGAGTQASVLHKGGFRLLTRLRYLRQTVALAPDTPRNSPDLEWVPFSPAVQPLFERTLELTYAQTHDCPELSGVRTTSDVLAGHRTTGVFDPALWWVATRDQEPVGVLLLSRLPSLPALEIVYMGVAQPVRGQGVAHALLRRAFDAAGNDGAKELTLAVDERNAPARHLYARWGFTEFGRRDAWIASLGPV